MPSLPPITVFDIETTGLDPKKGHRITEIAAVRIENGIILKESAFTTLVNPERDIPADVRQISHISDDMVKDAPTIMTVLPQFLEFVQGSILFAHNAAFDRSFIENEKEFCWGYVEIPACFCTMKLSQSLYPTAFRHSLDAITERFQMQYPENRHRALPDVLHTAAILQKFIEVGKIQSAEELKRRSSLQLIAA